MLILTNALSYAFFLVISKRLLDRVDPLSATAVLMTFGSLGILIVGWSELIRFDPASVSARTWSWGLYIMLFPTAFAYLLNYWALKRVNPSVVALFIYLQPVIATGLGMMFLGERLEPSALLGAMLIFGGVYLATRRPTDA